MSWTGGCYSTSFSHKLMTCDWVLTAPGLFAVLWSMLQYTMWLTDVFLITMEFYGKSYIRLWLHIWINSLLVLLPSLDLLTERNQRKNWLSLAIHTRGSLLYYPTFITQQRSEHSNETSPRLIIIIKLHLYDDNVFTPPWLGETQLIPL